MAPKKQDDSKDQGKAGEKSGENQGENTETYVVPPDGGWGWVVMIASFFCNVIVDGTIFSSGLMMTELVQSFGESTSKTAWVASLLQGFYLMAGPMVSAIANRFGFRAVAVTGSVIACVALVASSFATSLDFLFVSYGFLGGIGFGMVYVPAVIAVGFYFEKKRALATGIAVCGSGIGTFLFAPLSTWLIETFAWRGTLLIQAGLVLNCAVFGALFRPLEPVPRKKPTDNEAVESQGTPLMQRIKKARDEELRSEAAQNADNGDFKSSAHSLNMVKLIAIKQKRSSVVTASSPSIGPEQETLLEQRKISGSRRSIQGSQKSLARETGPGPFDREDVFFTGSLQRLPQYMNQTAEQYHASVTHIADSGPAAAEDENQNCCQSFLSGSAIRTLTTIFDFSLFKSASFLCICASGFLTFLGFFVPFMYLADRAFAYGVDKESASFLLSIIGITNTIGRVGSGWLSDHPKVSVLLINNVALTVCGLITIASPFLSSYAMLIIYSCLFGLCIACIASLRSILLVELLGLHRLTNAFGLMLLFYGLAATFGSPLAGMFFDATGSYDASFYLSGSMIFVSGLLCYPLGYINRWEKRRQARVAPTAEPPITSA